MRLLIAVLVAVVSVVGSAWAAMPPGAPGPATAGFTLVVNEPAESSGETAVVTPPGSVFAGYVVLIESSNLADCHDPKQWSDVAVFSNPPTKPAPDAVVQTLTFVSDPIDFGNTNVTAKDVVDGIASGLTVCLSEATNGGANAYQAGNAVSSETASYTFNGDPRRPGPGECFNGGDPSNGCSGGCLNGGPECASDDTGCVPDTADHLKCADAIVKAFSKALAGAGKCHCKQATALLGNKPFVEEDCEGHAPNHKGVEDKLDAAINKVAPLCSGTQLTFAAAEESVLFAGKNNGASLDAQNGNVYCDSTSGAMIMSSDSDDSGWVPADKNMLKCQCTVAKNLSKLAAATLKCHIKLADSFFKGKDFDENACEELDPVKHKSALERYKAAETTLLAKGICPPCLNRTNQDALGAGSLALIEAANGLGYPCP